MPLPLAVDSFREESVGASPFAGLAIGAVLLAAAHVFARGRGVLLLLVVLALESQRVCYVVWADDRRARALDLESGKELSFSFALPPVEELGDPVEDFRLRCWEVEAQRIGATSLNFQVLVNPPTR